MATILNALQHVGTTQLSLELTDDGTLSILLLLSANIRGLNRQLRVLVILVEQEAHTPGRKRTRKPEQLKKSDEKKTQSGEKYVSHTTKM